MRVRFATVIDVRPAEIAARNTGTGTAAGRTGDKGAEITYRLDDTGEIQALVQEQAKKNPIMKGDRIRILRGRTSTRAERD